MRENELRLNSDITLISATSQRVSVGFFPHVHENARDDFISSEGVKQGNATRWEGPVPKCQTTDLGT